MKPNRSFVKDACVPSDQPDSYKGPGFHITQEELEEKKKEYFERGGKIDKPEYKGDIPAVLQEYDLQYDAWYNSEID